MRLKLLSPGEMNPDQKETYEEAIAGKRGAAPAPMMAWLNSPQMARHATRLGEQLRFNTIFPAKLSEIAILVTARHWTAHYEWWAHKRLALKGGMDPQIIDDIRDRRTPRFDDPKGQMIHDVAKSTRVTASPRRSMRRPSRFSASADWSRSSDCAAITRWCR
jgi:4-carboxymuconolactone decarboxylase